MFLCQVVCSVCSRGGAKFKSSRSMLLTSTFLQMKVNQNAHRRRVPPPIRLGLTPTLTCELGYLKLAIRCGELPTRKPMPGGKPEALRWENIHVSVAGKVWISRAFNINPRSYKEHLAEIKRPGRRSLFLNDGIRALLRRRRANGGGWMGCSQMPGTKTMRSS